MRGSIQPNLGLGPDASACNGATYSPSQWSARPQSRQFVTVERMVSIDKFTPNRSPPIGGDGCPHISLRARRLSEQEGEGPNNPSLVARRPIIGMRTALEINQGGWMYVWTVDG